MIGGGGRSPTFFCQKPHWNIIYNLEGRWKSRCSFIYRRCVYVHTVAYTSKISKIFKSRPDQTQDSTHFLQAQNWELETCVEGRQAYPCILYYYYTTYTYPYKVRSILTMRWRDGSLWSGENFFIFIFPKFTVSRRVGLCYINGLYFVLIRIRIQG